MVQSLVMSVGDDASGGGTWVGHDEIESGSTRSRLGAS